jgi:hypothetical protein
VDVSFPAPQLSCVASCVSRGFSAGDLTHFILFLAFHPKLYPSSQQDPSIFQLNWVFGSFVAYLMYADLCTVTQFVSCLGNSHMPHSDLTVLCPESWPIAHAKSHDCHVQNSLTGRSLTSFHHA